VARAQRLSASEGKTVYLDGVYIKTVNASAQRLSASEGKTEVLQYRWSISILVLNAFRHQRGKQAKAHYFDRQKPVAVLNAFRHQRGKQAEGRDWLGWKCAVLNAFRHQRGKQFSLSQF